MDARGRAASIARVREVPSVDVVVSKEDVSVAVDAAVGHARDRAEHRRCTVTILDHPGEDMGFGICPGKRWALASRGDAFVF